MILYSRDDLLSLCRESTQLSLWVRRLTIIMSRVDPAFSMSEMTYYHYVASRPSLLYEWDDLLSLCRVSTQLSLLVRWSSMILYSRDDLLSLCRESTQFSLWVRWLTIIMSRVDPAFSMSEMTYYHYVASRPSFLYEWDDLLSLCRESIQPSLWVRWSSARVAPARRRTSLTRWSPCSWGPRWAGASSRPAWSGVGSCHPPGVSAWSCSRPTSARCGWWSEPAGSRCRNVIITDDVIWMYRVQT